MPDFLTQFANEHQTGKPSDEERRRRLDAEEQLRQLRQNRKRFIARNGTDELTRLAAEHEWSQIESRQGAVDPSVAVRAEQLRSTGGMVGAATDAGFWGGMGQAVLGAGAGLTGLAQTVFGDTAGADATYAEMEAYREARRRNTEEGLSSSDLVPQFDSSGGQDRVPMALMQADPSSLTPYAESRQSAPVEWLNRQIPGVAQSMIQSATVPGLGLPSALTRSAAQGVGFGAVQAAESASEARRAGLDASDQALYALLMGGAEGAFPAMFEMAGMGGIERAGARPVLNAADDVLKGGFKGLAKESLKREAQEQAEEGLTTLAQQGVTAAMMPGQGDALSIRDQEGNVSLNSPLGQAMTDTVAQTFLQGRTVNAAEIAASLARKGYEKRQAEAIGKFLSGDQPSRTDYAWLPREWKVYGGHSTAEQRASLAANLRSQLGNQGQQVETVENQDAQGQVAESGVVDNSGMGTVGQGIPGDDGSGGIAEQPAMLATDAEAGEVVPQGQGALGDLASQEIPISGSGGNDVERGVLPTGQADGSVGEVAAAIQGQAEPEVVPAVPSANNQSEPAGTSRNQPSVPSVPIAESQSEPVGASQDQPGVPGKPKVGDVFPTRFQGADRFAYREPDTTTRGYTDFLFDTEQQASEYADQSRRMAAEQEKSKAERQKLEDAEAERQQERKNLFGYEKSLEDAVVRGRAESVLNKPRNIGGEEISIKDYIKRLHDAGKIELRTEDAGNGGFRYFVNGMDLGKTGYMLAEHLEEQRKERDAKANGTALTPEQEANLFGGPKSDATGFDALPPKAKEVFEEAWEKGAESESWREIVDPANKNWRSEFERRSGEKLPKSITGSVKVVRDYFGKQEKTTNAATGGVILSPELMREESRRIVSSGEFKDGDRVSWDRNGKRMSGIIADATGKFSPNSFKVIGEDGKAYWVPGFNVIREGSGNDGGMVGSDGNQAGDETASRAPERKPDGGAVGNEGKAGRGSQQSRGDGGNTHDESQYKKSDSDAAGDLGDGVSPMVEESRQESGRGKSDDGDAGRENVDATREPVKKKLESMGEDEFVRVFSGEGSNQGTNPAEMKSKERKSPGQKSGSEKRIISDETRAEIEAFKKEGAAILNQFKDRLMSVGPDPEMMQAFGRLAYRAAKIGIKTFRDFAGYLIEATNREIVTAAMPHLRAAWDRVADAVEGFERTTNEDEKAVLNETNSTVGDRQDGREGKAVADDVADQEAMGRREAAGDGVGEKAGDGEGVSGGSGQGAAGDRGAVSTTGKDDSGTGKDGGGGGASGDTGRVAAGNYRIEDGSSIGKKEGKVATWNGNISAIKMLKEIEAKGRKATREEQDVLAQYRGWGGLKEVFITENAAGTKTYETWKPRGQELESLLTADEYAEARRSVMNAHYTSPEVIRAMWAGLTKAGFEGGRVLEPSMGVGHFVGLMPDVDAKVVGVDLDSISARISKLLYPEAKVIHDGFQNVKVGKFDVVISNVPFGSSKIRDESDGELKRGFSIHNFFFLKGLKSLRDGGVMAFITSRYTMDGTSPTHNETRELIEAWGGRLVGAVRLPSNAFEGIAKTSVTTDVIFIQKNAGEGQAWSEIKPDTASGVPINEYYSQYPENMLGTMDPQGGQNPGEAGLSPSAKFKEPGEIGKALQAAIEKMPFDKAALEKKMAESEYATKDAVKAVESDKEGRLVVDGEGLYKVVGGERVPVKWFGGITKSSEKREKIAAFEQLIESRNRLSELERDAASSDEEIEKARGELNRIYDAAVKKYGFINNRYNEGLMREDDEYPALVALENWDEEKQTATKADVFSKRIELPDGWQGENPSTPEAAVIASFLESGEIDAEQIGEWLGVDADAVPAKIEGLAFVDPETGSMVLKDQYLTGHVAKKLAVAKKAAENDSRFEANVKALENALPTPKKAGEFAVRLRSPLIGEHHIEQFAKEVFGFRVRVGHEIGTGAWTLDGIGVTNVEKWAYIRGASYSPAEMLEATLNNKPIKVYNRRGDERVFDEDATKGAIRQQRDMEQKFQEWLYSDDERTAEIEEAYNQTIGGFVASNWDGSHLRFPGMSQSVKLSKHQVDGVWRGLVSGNTLFAHEVGLGKTYMMAALAMERRRLGMVRNQMLVVPNHLLRQWTAEFKQLYPRAKLLALESGDINEKTRSVLTARVKSGDWDAIIVTKEAFKRIPMSAEYVKARKAETLKEINDAIVAARSGKKDSKNFVAKLEAMLTSVEQQMDDMLNRAEKDENAVPFEQLGIDAVYVDEAHEFRNLWAKTQMGQIPGVGVKGNQATFDMLFKVDHINGKTSDRGVVFATGTPVANSISELWAMQRYLQPKALKSSGVLAFDDWANMFGEVVTDIEVKPTGDGFRQQARFKRFTNVSALSAMFRQIADVKYAEDVGLDKERPKVKGGKAVTIEVMPSLGLLSYVRGLVKRMKDSKARGADKRLDNPLKVTTDGRKAALDMRLVLAETGDLRHSKVNVAAENIARVWREEGDNRGAQIVWMNLGTPAGKKKAKNVVVDDSGLDDTESMESGAINLYEDARGKLVEAGIPREQIAFIHEHDTPEKKQRVFRDVRAGKVRILFSTIAKLATGANIQTRLAALHFMDPPWKPADIEQARGRAIRRHNLYKDLGGVQIYNYVTKGSFDAYIWQLLENKEKAIRQIMDGSADSVEDVGRIELNADEVKALASSNPRIMEMVKLRAEVDNLLGEQRDASAKQASASSSVASARAILRGLQDQLGEEIEIAKRMPPQEQYEAERYVEIRGKRYTSAKEIGEIVDEVTTDASEHDIREVKIGSVNDGAVSVWAKRVAIGAYSKWVLHVGGKNAMSGTERGDSTVGMGTKVLNLFEGLYKVNEQSNQDRFLSEARRKLEMAEAAKEKASTPWPRSEELRRKQAELIALEAELGEDAKDDGRIPAVNYLTKYALMAEALSESLGRPVTAMGGDKWVFGDLSAIPSGKFESLVRSVNSQVVSMVDSHGEKMRENFVFPESAGVVVRPGEGDRIPRGNRNFGPIQDAAGSTSGQGPVPAAQPRSFAAQPETGAGQALASRITRDTGAKEPKVGARSIVEFMNRMLHAKLIVGKTQLSRQHPAHYESRGSLIRSVDARGDYSFHEAGHAMSDMLRDSDPNVFKRLGRRLIGLTRQPGSMASAKTPEEGIAEFVRLFVKGEYVDPKLESAMFERIERANPDVAKMLRDAHRLWAQFQARPFWEKTAANMADKPKVPVATRAVDLAYQIAASTIGGSWVVNKLNRMAAAAIVGNAASRYDLTGLLDGVGRIAKSESAAKYQMFRDVKESLKRTRGDIGNAYHARMDATSEAERVMGGAKEGREGVRILNLGGGFANLSPRELAALRAAGFEIPKDAENAGYGEHVWLSDRSFAKIRADVGDAWPQFEQYALYKASLDRFDKKGQQFPNMEEVGSPEELRNQIELVEQGNPAWIDRFKEIQKLMDQMLLLTVLTGEKTVDEVVTIKNAYEHYVPLRRELEEYEQFAGGGGDEMTPTSGIRTARGSGKQFLSLEAAVRIRARAAMKAYYEDALRKAVLAWQEAFETNKDVSYAARKAIGRTMVPLRADMARAATLSPDEQRQIVADAMNRELLGRLTGSPVSADFTDKRVRGDLEGLGEIPFGAEDVSLAMPGRPVFRSTTPRASQVVTTFEGGQLQFWQVLDPQVYEFFATSPRANKYVEFVSNLLADISAPFKRAVVQGVAYGIINVGFRDALAAMANGRLRAELVPGFVAATGIVNRLMGDTWGVKDVGVADSLARGLNRAAGSPHRDDGKGVMGRIFASGVEMLGEGITDRDWTDPSKWIGGVASVVTKPADIYNWMTFGRLVSQWAETMSREGAAILAMRDGGSTADAIREAHDISGRFVQQGMSPNAAAIVKGFMFLNPQIQLWSQVVEQAFDADPEVRRQLFAVKMPLIAAAGASAAAIVALVRALFMGDDEWDEWKKKEQERTESDRVGYADVGLLRMPLDTGVVGTTFSFGFNSVVDWVYQVKRQEGANRAAMLLKRMADLPLPSDQGLHFSAGISELISGRRSDGTRIVPEHLERKYPNNPELQKFDDTGVLYQKIGSLTGASPLKARYALRQIYAGEIVRLLDAAQKIVDGDELKPHERPVIGRLASRDPSGWASRSVVNLEEIEHKYDAARGTLKAALKSDEDVDRAMLNAVSDELEAAHQAFLSVEKIWRDRKKEKGGQDEARTGMLEAARKFVDEKKLIESRLGSLASDLKGDGIDRLKAGKAIRGTENTADEVFDAFVETQEADREKAAEKRAESGKMRKGEDIRREVLRRAKDRAKVRSRIETGGE